MLAYLRLAFSRRWWWTTLFMLFAVGVMVRLGIWQLDRLAARRADNAHIRAMQAAPALDLNSLDPSTDLETMEYRAAVARGTFIFDDQVALRNQYWGIPDGPAEYGHHLLTPLLLEDGRAVLVDRGWIPGSYTDPAAWHEFDQPGEVAVSGILRLSQSEAEMGGLSTGDTLPGQPQDFWVLPDLAGIAGQLTYELLPVYLQHAPPAGEQALPYKALPELVLTDGSHLGFALQWFFYASLVFFGYPVFLRRRKGE
jgi:surfeit locus 1 family protein